MPVKSGSIDNWGAARTGYFFASDNKHPEAGVFCLLKRRMDYPYAFLKLFMLKRDS